MSNGGNSERLVAKIISLFVTLFFLVSILTSCRSTTKHPDLISFNCKYLRDYSLAELRNREKAKTTISTKNSGDTLKAIVELPQAGCIAFEGDIDSRNDTLFLKYWNPQDEACTELVYYQLTYLVRSKNKKYTVHLVRE